MTQELELASRFSAGEAAAFVALYHAHKKAIYAFCFRLLGDKDSAMDGVQEVFLRAWENHRQLRDPARFRSWLFSIAHHYCLTSMRRRIPLWKGAQGTADEPAVDPADSRDEELQLLQAALARLQPEDRELVVLREFQQLHYQEIAAITGMTLSAVRSRLHRARHRLFDILKKLSFTEIK
ncbi:MAG TPA: RNA polymerase sigma factor [bacterium]|nr:RNA polymerase sigma factor [bacterium]HPR87484.1 RNA polymerase sigma factor [bacterium]